MAILFVMVDGVGLAPAGDDNPVPASMPELAAILGVALDDRFLIVTP